MCEAERRKAAVGKCELITNLATNPCIGDTEVFSEEKHIFRVNLDSDIFRCLKYRKTKFRLMFQFIERQLRR